MHTSFVFLLKMNKKQEHEDINTHLYHLWV